VGSGNQQKTDSQKTVGYGGFHRNKVIGARENLGKDKRIRCVIFGCTDASAGAAGSVINLVQMPTLNHSCDVASGVLQGECAAILQKFFRGLRDEQTDRVKGFASRGGRED
jgi:predicted glycosyltransferase